MYIVDDQNSQRYFHFRLSNIFIAPAQSLTFNTLEVEELLKRTTEYFPHCTTFLLNTCSIVYDTHSSEFILTNQSRSINKGVL